MNDTSPRQSRKEESRLAPVWSVADRLARRRCTLCLLTLTWLAGCEPDTPPPEHEHLPAEGAVIAFIGPATDHGQWEAMCGGARRETKIYPMVKLEAVPVKPGGLDLAVSHAMEVAPAAVCMYIPPGDDPDPAVRRITGAGAYVVTIGSGDRQELAFGHVRVDTTGAAEILGDRLNTIAGDRRGYLLVHWASRSPADFNCRARFFMRARHCVSVPMICERDAGEASSAALTRDLLSLFPNARLIITLDPLPWLTESPELLVDDHASFATIGAPPELWPSLRNGRAVALCGPLDGEVGKVAVELALGAMTQSVDPGEVRTVACELVTLPTLDSFSRRYAEAAGLPLDQLLRDTDVATQPASSPVGKP